MTGTEIMAVVGFGILVFGAIAGGFWRFWGLISDAGGKGQKAQDDLRDYRTHVAEHYATKAGMNEGLVAVQKSINDMSTRLDHRFDTMTDRLDRVIEAGHKPTRRQT